MFYYCFLNQSYSAFNLFITTRDVKVILALVSSYRI